MDTATKRFSMMDFGGPVGGLPYPPDSEFDQGDMQTFLCGYSGILWEQFAVISGVIELIIQMAIADISINEHMADIEIESTPATITAEEG